MKGPGLAPFMLQQVGKGKWVAPEMTESEKLVLEIGLLFGGNRNTKPKRVGRPKLPDVGGKDCFRAFKIWEFVNHFDDKNLRSKSNRLLIDLVQKFEEIAQIQERTFPSAGNFESSVSRGRRKLQIDKRWNSKVCEKISGT